MFVMIGALGINMITFHFILKRQSPLFVPESPFDLPRSTVVDKRLVGGAAIFGLGWGLSGLCPGPGMIDLFTSSYIVFWILGLALG